MIIFLQIMLMDGIQAMIQSGINIVIKRLSKLYVKTT